MPTLGICRGAVFNPAVSPPVLVAGADIEVRRESDNALASIFQDRAGTVPQNNGGSAFQTDANGAFKFYAAAREAGYRITVTKAGLGTLADHRNVPIGMAQYFDAATYGGSLLLSNDAAAARALLDVPSNAEVNALLAVVPNVPVRQTVLSAAVAAGLAAWLTAGAGLNFNVAASPTPAVLSFANGFSTTGASDLLTTLSVNQTNQGSLAASNINFLHATRVSATAVTWGSTLVQPYYGPTFDKTIGSMLDFDGADASTTIVDGFGNTWTASGNAQLDTAQSKFGTASLLLDGTGDYISCTDIKSFGDGSWSVELWFRIAALPGAGTSAMLFSAANASGGWGMRLYLSNTAGTTRLAINASSNNSSDDIANAVTGANTTWTLNQWNRVRLVFDSLGGTYRAYLSLNAAAETQDISISSSSRVMPFDGFRLGATAGGTSFFNGWIDHFRFIRGCATKTSTETPGGTARTIAAFPVHYYSTVLEKMYEVTAPSASAGTDPTLTERVRLFVGEAETNGSAVTLLRNYALKGQFESIVAGVGVDTSVNFAHNLGVNREQMMVEFFARGVPPANGIYQQWAPVMSWSGTQAFPAEAYAQSAAHTPQRYNVRYRTFNGGSTFHGNSFTTGYQIMCRVRRAF